MKIVRPITLAEFWGAFGGVIVTALVMWNTMSSALAVVESRQLITEKRVEIIEQNLDKKYDRLNDKIDQIIILQKQENK